MQTEHVNVTNQIIAYLKQNIEEGKWREGEKLPSENELTRELGVSRASVRTAIQYLSGIGALESVHGKGTFLLNADTKSWGVSSDMITVRDCEDFAKVLEFRKVVEPEACYLAVLRDEGGLVGQLEKYLEDMKKNIDNKSLYVQADINYHEAICKASGNPLLHKSIARVFRETRMQHDKVSELFGFREGIRYHTMILHAVKARDEILARELMYEHLENQLSSI